MFKKFIFLIFLLFFGTLIFLSFGCAKEEKKLIVYAGKGLEAAVSDIVHSFEHKHGVKVSVIYGGSQTILSVIQKTQKGDIFIPGGLHYMEQAGDLISNYKIVATHQPVLAVRIDNTKNIHSLQDLTKPGIRLAIGNKKICAIGKTTEKLLKQNGNLHDFLANVTVYGVTANELLDLVIQGEVDAAITHGHLLNLPKAKEIRKIALPGSRTNSLAIPLGILRVAENKTSAHLFYSYVETEGRDIFEKHGFGG